ncbi:MAG TPA: BrnA antitoxin family protein [Candidatus Nanopelagicaceae bacterium]|jgi:uncharacterized protein (DUF4415 family)
MKKKLNEDERRRQLERLAAMPDESIDTSDIPERSLDQLRGAKRADLFRPLKKPMTMRIDADILDWLKQLGPGYQTKVNQMLREHMLVAEQSSFRSKDLAAATARAESSNPSIRSLRLWSEPMLAHATRETPRIWEQGASAARTPSANTPSTRTPQRNTEAA